MTTQKESESAQEISYSFIAPLLNEEGNVRELHHRIVEVAKKMGKSFEIIFVDDGSDDETVKIAQMLSPLTLIEFRKRFGQTAGLDAGIKAARGDVIFTMDGDLQDDPAETLRLLAKLEEGYDVVASWRYNRRDSLMKKIFSRGADVLRKVLLNDTIHDSGCQLRVYRRECFGGVDLFGEMHRFIPAILELDGWKIAEIKVTHHPRTNGVTKYNWHRAIKGFTDMVAIWFWQRYAARPIHFFGGVGIIFGAIGSCVLLWMFIEKVFFDAAIAERIWPLVGIFFLLGGMQLFIFGLLADIAMKDYYRGRGRMNYIIKNITKY